MGDFIFGISVHTGQGIRSTEVLSGPLDAAVSVWWKRDFYVRNVLTDTRLTQVNPFYPAKLWCCLLWGPTFLFSKLPAHITHDTVSHPASRCRETCNSSSARILGGDSEHIRGSLSYEELSQAGCAHRSQACSSRG